MQLVNAPRNAIDHVPKVAECRRLSVEVLDPLNHAAYDEMASAFTDSVPFHSTAWLRIIRDTYGHRPLCFVAKSGGDAVAMLPVVEIESWITGRRGVMLPFADYCPPLARDSVAHGVVLAEAIKYAKERKWKHLEIRGGRKFMGDARASVAYYGHILDLSIGRDELYKGLDSRMRGAIRKAEREGVVIEVAMNSEAMHIYYGLHVGTRKKHGVPPQPFSFFQSIFDHSISKQSGIIVVARLHGVPIAAAVFLHNGRHATYKFSASNEAFRAVPGNSLVMWKAIEWYAGQGQSSLHFGRTSLGNDGLRKYKAGWGAEESLLEYFKYDISKQACVADTDRSDGGQNRVLRLLPNPVFCLVGRILYRHLS